jgi:YesN/AraC family two-component response regulator
VSAARRLRIAVADDEPDVREYFSKILPLLGHEVVAVAATGAELVDACRRTLPDLVITDVKMPDKDGLDAVREILRERPVRVIVITGYQDRAHKERARTEGILNYLLKPVKRADLEATLARVLQAM